MYGNYDETIVRSNVDEETATIIQEAGPFHLKCCITEGQCDLCGVHITAGAAFINTGGIIVSTCLGDCGSYVVAKAEWHKILFAKASGLGIEGFAELLPMPIRDSLVRDAMELYSRYRAETPDIVRSILVQARDKGYVSVKQRFVLANYVKDGKTHGPK